ncbi:hypothetical protein [Streptomyces bluensis]|uniref:hypothetical protein n=1 Tax=Streptomyces bluensis TaxID=33897 RepID=UPI00332DE9F1
MLHTVLRRREGGESVGQIQPDLIIPTGKGEGQNPSVAGIDRALAEHAKREAYPEAVEQAQADFASLTGGESPNPAQKPRPLRRSCASSTAVDRRCGPSSCATTLSCNSRSGSSSAWQR